MKERPPITSVFLTLTHACNLACRYCFVHQEPKHMTLKIAKDSVDWLIDNAKETKQTPSINFFGGEPMLMWDSIIVPLTEYIRRELRAPFSLSMTSNCTLMTEERLSYMKDNNIGLLFSIDGAKETQDYNRPYHGGLSSFDALEPIIPFVLKYFPSVTFRSTIIPQTAHLMFENIMFAEKMGFKNMFMMPNQFEEWDEEHIEILRAQLELLGDHYISKFRDDKILINFTPIQKCFPKIYQINQRIASNYTRCSSGSTCGLGASKYAAIDPSGKIFTCQQMTSAEENPFYIGDIYKGVDQVLRAQIVNSYDVRKLQGENCKNCLLAPICGGGCVANNFMIQQSVNIATKMFCIWEQLVMHETIRIFQTLGNERNKLFKQYLKRDKIC